MASVCAQDGQTDASLRTSALPLAGLGAGAAFALSKAMVHVAAIFFVALGLSSAGYLTYRIIEGALRLRRSRTAYPCMAVARSTTPLQGRVRGAMIGHAVGDALNLPAESVPRWLVRIRYRRGPAMRAGLVRFLRRPGDVSDDTQLTIAVARSVETGRYNHNRFVEELGAWWAIRIGAGRATARVALRARNRTQPKPESSEGNGAAIRVVPLAIATRLAPVSDLVALVAQNAGATHDTSAAARGAVAIAVLVRQALNRGPLAFDDVEQLGAAIEAALSISAFDASLPTRETIRTDDELHAHLATVGTTGHVYQCIPAVILVLLRHRLDIVGAMRSIFFAGGDTDSIGAMVGSVIGAQVGVERLPGVWTERVQHRGYLCHLADNLYSSSSKASSKS